MFALVPLSLAAAERPLPVIDMHLHALGAGDQGPPPLHVCVSPEGWPAWEQSRPWAEVFIEALKHAPCANPVASPLTDDALRDETLGVLRRRNVIGVLSGPVGRVQAWRELEPDRIIPGLILGGPPAPTPDQLREFHRLGRLAVLGEVTIQYAGLSPSDPWFERYLAMAEELDIPVGIHIGPGPPGSPYLVNAKYRAALHSPLVLEEALIRHPKLRVYIMHAGWPMLDDLLAVLWAHPQVHVEVGVIVWGLPRAEFYRYLQRIVEAGFGRRVMFGSDQMVWPGVIEPSIRLIEEAPFLSPAQQRDILYHNAARFLRLSEDDIRRHHGSDPGG